MEWSTEDEKTAASEFCIFWPLTLGRGLELQKRMEQYSILYMYHIFFIHSSVDGHLDCFHIWAIINSAVVNFRGHVYFQTMFFCRYMPRSEPTGSHTWEKNLNKDTCISYTICIAESLLCTSETIMTLLINSTPK